ncbi:MAG: hypothetical protein KDA24_08555 [Deltaproteobacteria bacterium]|nr:hypothetical protein [Deltaproteobacteria bacterium]
MKLTTTETRLLGAAALTASVMMGTPALAVPPAGCQVATPGGPTVTVPCNASGAIPGGAPGLSSPFEVVETSFEGRVVDADGTLISYRDPQLTSSSIYDVANGTTVHVPGTYRVLVDAAAELATYTSGDELYVLDLATGVTANTGLPYEAVDIEYPYVLWGVRECDVSPICNLDGDDWRNEWISGWYDVVTGQSEMIFGDGTYGEYGGGAFRAVGVDAGVVAMDAPEHQLGYDFEGDGVLDPNHRVIALHDIPTGSVVQTTIPTGWLGLFDADDGLLVHSGVLHPNGTPELQIYDTVTQTSTHVAGPPPTVPDLEDGTLAWAWWSRQNPNDPVTWGIRVYDVATGATVESPDTGASGVEVANRDLIAFTLREAYERRDINGDGDLRDEFVAYLNRLP